MRYADAAKKIKNKAVINEDPQDKLIRELKAENDKLKAALAQSFALSMLTKPAGQKLVAISPWR